MSEKPDSSIIADAISRELISGKAHLNLAQQSIVITEDRAYRCLSKWNGSIEAKDRWITPVCVTASLVLTFVTSNFRSALGIPADSWQAFFMIAVALSGAWALYEVIRLFISRIIRREQPGSLDDLIEKLKRGSTVVDLHSADTNAHPPSESVEKRSNHW